VVVVWVKVRGWGRWRCCCFVGDEEEGESDRSISTLPSESVGDDDEEEALSPSDMMHSLLIVVFRGRSPWTMRWAAAFMPL
jgi:hypothetical protein